MGGSFNRGGNGGGRSFGGARGGSRFGGGRSNDRGPVTMHKATCSECYKECEVPFRPNGDKPIYCNDCFSSKRDHSGGADRGGDRFPRKDFGSRAPMRPSFDNRSNEEIKKQLELLNTKLDKLISNLEKGSAVSAVLEEIKAESPKKEKKIAVKKEVVKKKVAKK